MAINFNPNENRSILLIIYTICLKNLYVYSIKSKSKIKKIGLIVILVLISINICFAYNSTDSTDNDLINSINQINNNLTKNNNEINRNLEKINVGLIDNYNQANTITNKLNLINEKLGEHNYSPIFLTIAGVLGSLLAILFAITSIFISNIKDKFGITLTEIKKNEKKLYFILAVGILLNLFHILLTNTYKLGTLLFIIFDILYLIFMFNSVWKHFELVNQAGNLKDAIKIKYKEIKKLPDNKKAEMISQLYGLIDYSINNNIKFYSFGMIRLAHIIKFVKDYKIQRELFNDFSDLIIKAPRRYSREVLKLYVDIANKIKDNIIKQKKEGNSEFIRTGENLHFVTVKLKELSKELLDEDQNMDRSVLSYALLTDVNKANVEVIKKQKPAFYLCSSSITWALELINKFIHQNHDRLEHPELYSIFLNLYIYFDQLKQLLTIADLETDVKNNINLILSKYEEYADEILSKPTPNIQDVWKKQIINNNASHFSTINDQNIDSKILHLQTKYSS